MKDLNKYIDAIEIYIKQNYKNNFREPCRNLPYKYLVPGANYAHTLWDWDSWLTGSALLEIDDLDIKEYEMGCILNFLSNIDEKGRIPILCDDRPGWFYNVNDKLDNIHKPCLAIHALEICEHFNEVDWIKDKFDLLKRYISYYENNQKHLESGLYFWLSDVAIGFDNDPTVFYQPDKSSAAIFLNSLMYKELLSMSKLASLLGLKDDSAEYLEKAEHLKQAIKNECFDKVDGYFYSAFVGLRDIDPKTYMHSGHPRFWHSLPIKITTWAGMLPLWAGIANQEEADACVKRYINPDGLYSEFGIRSVAKNEKMYGIFNTGNPSCWLGPIWINANYFTYMGLKQYGYNELAQEIAVKTIKLLGQDIIKNGEFHEYYDSETGVGVRGKGFQSWNFLVIKMIDDMKHSIYQKLNI